MATFTVEEQVHQLYVGLLGRPADKDGFDYWVDDIKSGNITIEAVRSNFVNEQAEGQEIYGSGKSREEIVTILYNNLFDRDPDADGLEYWVNGDGADVSADLLVYALVQGAGSNDSAALEEKISESEDVVKDPDNLIELTDGRDVKNGTAGDDAFVGDVGQNQNGAVANAFSSGDILDGGAGRDKIEATLINDNQVDGADANISINARTSNIEEVHLGVLDENVVVDGGRMDSVEEFWSDDSDASLVIEDVRLGSKLSVTKDITFGMRDVDQQSGLVAAFESQSLTNEGTFTSNSQILVEVGDSNKAADATDPLELIELTLNFTFNGQDYSFEDIVSTDGTYQGLIEAIDAALDAQGLTSLEVTAGNVLNSIRAENDDVPLLYDNAFQIIITDPNGNPFENFTSGVGAAPSQQSSNPVSNTDVRDPSTSTTLIESNLILDNAGRGSTAGDAVIGGMSNSNTVVEKLNLVVDRNSRIDDLATASGMEDVGTDDNGNYTGTMVGFQIIELTSTGADGILSINDIQNTNTFEANAFEGASLTINNADELQILNANINGNVTVVADTEEGANVYTTGSGTDSLTVNVEGDDVDTIGESFTANTNGGDDTVTITMTNGVSYDTMDELDNLEINTSSGEDYVDLNAYGTFEINTGNDSDFVRINSTDENGNATLGTWTIGDTSEQFDAYFDARVLYEAKLTVSFAGFEQVVDIPTTREGDFIATQTDINEAIIAAIQSNHELNDLLTIVPSTGNQALQIISNVGGLNNFGVAIYQPQLVDNSAAVTVGEDAGENVLLATGDVEAMRQGLIATGVEPNSENLENVTEIVNVTDAAGNWYGSVNADGTADQQLHSNADLAGDVTEGVNTADNAGGIFQDTAAGGLYYDLGNGTSGQNDSTGAVNLSAINAGAGSNDIVVMHSGDLASNTLVIDQNFGKVSVVNWHTDASENVVDVTAMGEHALDFTAFLNNRQDTSAGTNPNNDSATAINTTVNLVAGASSFGAAVSPGVNNSNSAAANSVNVIRFAQDFANGETFDALTADRLVAALNDNANDGSNDYGNLDQGLLNPVVNGDLVGNTQDHIVMVESDLNEGEYKVFYLTSTLNQNKTQTGTQGTGGNNLFDTNAVELGTLDFGASINFNVVGSEGYNRYITALQDALDAGQGTFSYVDAGGNTVNVTLPGANVTDYTLANAVIADGNNSLQTPYNITDIDTVDLNKAVADLPNANQAIIDGAANSADYVYSISDNSANIAGADQALVDSADAVVLAAAETVADDVAGAATLVGRLTDTTGLTLDVTDTAAAILGADQAVIDAANSVALTAPETVSDTAANAATLLDRLTDTNGLTLDVVDTADAITTAIDGGASLAGANSIQHDDVDVATGNVTGTNTVADTFVFDAAADASIVNFEDGTDTIDLSAFVANADVDFGNADDNGDTVDFIVTLGNGAGTDTTVGIDLDDDGNVDNTITLVGVNDTDNGGSTIDANDFAFA